MREVEPGKAGTLADDWQAGYKEKAKGFLATVPSNLKSKFDDKLFDAERGLYGAASTFARGEQKRSSLNDINDFSQNNYYPRARSGEPLDKISKDYESLVKANPYLTPIEKDEVLREGYGSLEEAHVLGRVDRGDDVDDVLRDIRGGTATKTAGEHDAQRAAISSRLETGTDDPMKGVANISRDSGGTKSYGNFGLNSGGSAQKFAAEFGKRFGLTAKPGTATFDEQWQQAANSAPGELHEAEMQWYRSMTDGIGTKLANAGVPKEMADDPRVQAYFADRVVQQGEGSIDAMGKHKARIGQAAAAANGDAAVFLQNITEADRGSLRADFPTALRSGVYSEEGHDTRLDGRLKLALDMPADGERAALPTYDGQYRNLSPKRRMELENKIRTTVSEKTQQELRDGAEQIRRTGQVPRDDQGRTALERSQHLLTKNQVEKFSNDWMEAGLEFNALSGLDALPERDLQDRLDSIAPRAGEADYEIKAKVFDKATSGVKKLRELRDHDPAASVSTIPEVKEAETAARAAPDDPEATQTLARVRLDAQSKVGIPEGLRTPITKNEAKIIMSPVRGLEGKALISAMGEVVGKVETQYGPYARAVTVDAIDTVIKNKDLADTVTGVLNKTLRGLPVSAADQRRVEFLSESAQAERAFGGTAGEPMRQYGITPAGPQAVASPDVAQNFGGGLSTRPLMKQPSPKAIEVLKANPGMAADFNAFYGAGAAELFLNDAFEQGQKPKKK